MPAIRYVLALALALTACNGDDDFVAPGSANAGCGDTAPVIDLLTVEEGDAVGDGVPSVRITANASDADYDLHWYTMRVWAKEDQAASENMEGDYFEIYGYSGADCNTQAAALRMQIGITGNPPEDTDMWWTAVVYDDQDHASEPWTEFFRTPQAQ
ncbi:MAG: hypothetical protein EP330_18495 [Deltaproteobacteria bacterium]|nr:MAG: hypothetical protein EP330_18495 [Deltaproteobacteria bacterium]